MSFSKKQTIAILALAILPCLIIANSAYAANPNTTPQQFILEGTSLGTFHDGSTLYQSITVSQFDPSDYKLGLIPTQLGGKFVGLKGTIEFNNLSADETIQFAVNGIGVGPIYTIHPSDTSIDFHPGENFNANDYIGFITHGPNNGGIIEIGGTVLVQYN